MWRWRPLEQHLVDSDLVPHLRLRNVKRTFEMGNVRVEALRTINLDIGKGEMVAIEGPSGSGKTSLLNILGCLDQPSMGFYQLHGLNVGVLSGNSLAELRQREIGFVFQSFNLLTNLTVLENVTLPLTYTRAKHPEARAMEALERVGLAHRARLDPDALTGGEQQRVAIARALVNSPNLILADEPTGNINSQAGSDVLKLFRNLNTREGITIVVATHNHTVTEAMDRTVSMHDGTVSGGVQINRLEYGEEGIQ